MAATAPVRVLPARILSVLITLILFFTMGLRADDTPAPNLLPTACHFTTDTAPKFPSMLDEAAQADCTGKPSQSSRMVWLSLDVQLAKPASNTAYDLTMLRHWTERAVIQFHYADGYMLDYDVGAYDFDTYWSVGNHINFQAPARSAPVSHILVGFQNASSIKLFHEITLVKSADWATRQTAGLLLTTVITGILLAMFFYNIALAAVLRFNFHFHYCLVAFAALAYNITAYGFLSYLLPGLVSHGDQMNITILALGLNGLAGILFLCSFLEDGILTPGWVLAARIVGYSFFGLSIVYVNMRGPYTETLELWLHITSFIGVIFVLAVLGRAIRMKSKAAIFYAIGWMLPVAGVLVRNLREFEILPHSDLIGYMVSIGISLESVIFAIGIAYRISKIMNERDLAKLESAKAMAANQAKTDFLAHMSHEIRNPMSTIIGLSKLTAETKLNAQQREYIRNIQLSGDALMSLLNNTLDISKIEAGKVSLESLTFAPNDVFDKVQAIIGPNAQEKAIDFTIEGQAGLPPQLTGDPTRLSQILINLASNAVKFTDNGGVTITVSSVPNSEKSILFSCRVTDTGVGMTEGEISRLFQSFSQADVSVARKYGGTGLGLAICKQLVELMGGKITVESTPGEGSSFYFELPFTIPNPAAQTGSVKGLNNAENPRLEGMQILVVEDNQVNQLLITKLLEPTLAEFEIVSSGEAAVKAAATKDYDIILMDIHMPGMGGLEATKAIRAQEGAGNQQTPILALTGSENIETKKACLKAGMNDQIIKPFTPAILFETLVAWRHKPS